MFPNRRLKYSCLYWNLHTKLLKSTRLSGEQLLTLKYEDFVSNAAEHLERILRFAGLWDEAAAAKMLNEHPASAGSIDKWRKDLAEEEILVIESVCFDNMRHYGYEPELAKKAVRLSMFTKSVETVLDNWSRIPRSLSGWQNKNIVRRFWRTIRV
jgi:hypothetical protein